jgi:hypothetical protein
MHGTLLTDVEAHRGGGFCSDSLSITQRLQASKGDCRFFYFTIIGAWFNVMVAAVILKLISCEIWYKCILFSLAKIVTIQKGSFVDLVTAIVIKLARESAPHKLAQSI